MPDRPDPIEAAAEALWRHQYSRSWESALPGERKRFLQLATAALTASGLLAVEEERDRLRTALSSLLGWNHGGDRFIATVHRNSDGQCAECEGTWPCVPRFALASLHGLECTDDCLPAHTFVDGCAYADDILAALAPQGETPDTNPEPK